MQYLDPSEYVSFGLTEETSDSLVTAAFAMIDAFCKRISLGVTQYCERLRFGRSNTLQLSNRPLEATTTALSALVSVRVRGRCSSAELFQPLAFEATCFLTGSDWCALDPSTIDVGPDALLSFKPNLFGGNFAEAEVTYTAGFGDIPTAVKVACAQIVRNAQAMPALNVRRQSLDSMQMEYFSGTLLDGDVRRLLQPYVSERMG